MVDMKKIFFALLYASLPLMKLAEHTKPQQREKAIFTYELSDFSGLITEIGF